MNPNDDDNLEDDPVYAGLGVNNEPDAYNEPDDEAQDTILHTDTQTAQHATEGVSNDADELDLDEEEKDLKRHFEEDQIEEQISELAQEEDLGNERY